MWSGRGSISLLCSLVASHSTIENGVVSCRTSCMRLLGNRRLIMHTLFFSLRSSCPERLFGSLCHTILLRSIGPSRTTIADDSLSSPESSDKAGYTPMSVSTLRGPFESYASCLAVQEACVSLKGRRLPCVPHSAYGSLSLTWIPVLHLGPLNGYSMVYDSLSSLFVAYWAVCTSSLLQMK